MTESLTILKKGYCEITEVSDASIGEEPVVSLKCLPFLHPDSMSKQVWHLRKMMPLVDKVVRANWNGTVIAPQPFPPIYFFSKEPIVTMDDVRGKKVRTWGGIAMEALEMIGMEPFMIDTSEIYTALQRGLIDTAITSYVSASECHFWEVLKYIDRLSLFNHDHYYVMNLDAYNALPPDLQEVLMDTCFDWSNYWYAKLYEEQMDLRQLLLDGGMVIVDPDPETVEECKRLTAPLRKEFADKCGPEAVQLLKDLGAY